jgi:fibronectin-binding autotransporter adhesin
MATRTISNAGGNWNTTGAWVEGVVAVNGDAVVATATSGNLTVTAAAACTSMVLTGYVGTMTINNGQTLTVAGAVTLASGMTLAGTGTLSSATAATWTSNGKSVPWNVSFTGNVTYTLADNWQIDGLLTISGNTATFNGNQIRMGGSVNISGNTAGTTTYLYNGTGTWTGSTTIARRIAAALEINTAGTLTMAANGMQFGSVITYTAGTIVSTGSTMRIGANTSLLGAWPSLNSILVGASSTLTLDNPLTVTGDFSIGNQTLTMAGGQGVSCGSLTFTAATGTLARGATGAWSVSGALTISGSGTAVITGAQDMTVGGINLQNGSTLRFVSGQTLTCAGTVRLNGTSYATTTLRGETASSSMTLALAGADVQADYLTITDVIATGQKLWNFAGGTLTRVTNVANFSTTPDDYTDPGVANVLSGVSYLYGGSTLNGTFDEAARNTDPGISNVALGVSYKIQNANLTGTLSGGGAPTYSRGRVVNA